MPRPTQKSKQPPPPAKAKVVTIEGAWLLRALALVFTAALLCTYITLCLLFYRGQSQAVLHPVRSPQSSTQDTIHFGAASTGQPQLAGEWFPAPSGSRYNCLTILFLSSGDGNRTSFAATQQALQQLGLNVFTFDYRGYGQSSPLRPSQRSMTEDSEAAWSYLTSIRRLPASSILPYGVGTGASLATGLAAAHPEIPALILDSPYTDLHEIIRRDPRLRFLPTSLLFKEDFPLTAPLSTLNRPKLLLSTAHDPDPTSFASASNPKITVQLSQSSGPLFDQAIRRFLDQYLAQHIVVPSQAPSGTNLR